MLYMAFTTSVYCDTFTKCIFGQYRGKLIDNHRLDQQIIIERVLDAFHTTLNDEYHLYLVPIGFGWNSLFHRHEYNFWEYKREYGVLAEQHNFARIHQDYVKEI